ncbi:hypothetical protein [Gorillibacterium sp. CAU 1737]|uniref:hypothetical protein n=1 Tax=Gorillibacterium sp. CAU 1737 TaxID=3140362 RepID=UPI003260EC86
MHRVIKIRYTLFYGGEPEANANGYMELNAEGHLIALFNQHGEEIDLYGGHEYVKVRTLGTFNNDDRDDFYSLLESDGVG